MGEADIDSIVDEVLNNILKDSKLRPLEESTYWTSCTQKGEQQVYARKHLNTNDIKGIEDEAYPIIIREIQTEIIEEDINYFLNFKEQDIWKFNDLCYKLFSNYSESNKIIIKIYMNIIIIQSHYYKLLADTYNSNYTIYKTKKRMNDKNDSRNSIKSYETAIDNILNLLDAKVESNIERDVILKAELRSLKTRIPNYLDKNKPIEPDTNYFTILIVRKLKENTTIKDRKTERVKELIESLITKEKLEYIKSYLGSFIQK